MMNSEGNTIRKCILVDRPLYERLEKFITSEDNTNKWTTNRFLEYVVREGLLLELSEMMSND